jgi:hypothetical protein
MTRSKHTTAAAGLAFLMALVLAAPAATAKSVVPIGGKHSQAEIRGKCSAAGGRYFEGDFTYGCTNDNKGTQVICDKSNSKCHGIVPIVKALGGANRVAPDLGEILR